MSNNIQLISVMIYFGLVAIIMGTSVSIASPVQAVADIRGCIDASIEGTAKLIERYSEEGIKEVDVTINVRGLSYGKHAVHIHEIGNCTPCSVAAGHFDPGPDGDTNPDGNHPFHSGDLINIDVNQSGFGVLHTSTTRVTLSPGPLCVCSIRMAVR